MRTQCKLNLTIFHLLALWLAVGIMWAQCGQINDNWGSYMNTGVCIGCARVFGNQHDDIGNAKCLRWGSCPTRDSNEDGFWF